MGAIRVTAWIAAVLTYGLIVLGAVVRSTGSGLACPDWPTCYGSWVLTPADLAAMPGVAYSYGQVMLEWSHRFVAGVLVGPLAVLLAVMALARSRRAPGLAGASLIALALVLVQAGLGAITVLDGNSPWSVAAHLGMALLVLTTLLYVAVNSAPQDRDEDRAVWLGRLAALTWLCALVAIVSAAITAKSGASLACATWPHCNGAWLPDLGDPQLRINVLHRAAAAATGLLVLLILIAAWPTRCRFNALLAVTMILAEIALGALVVVLEVPIWTAVLHQALGVLTFATVTALLWRARRPVLLRMAPTLGGERRGFVIRRA